MNRKTLLKLSVLAVCSALVFLFAPGNGGSIMVLAAMPFTLLGKGLRALYSALSPLPSKVNGIAAKTIMLPPFPGANKNTSAEHTARTESFNNVFRFIIHTSNYCFTIILILLLYRARFRWSTEIIVLFN